MRKKAKTKLLEDVCLHCAFFQMHEDKWPNWRPSDGENVDPRAFNDMVRSAIQIVAQIFSLMDEKDRMRFFHNVEHTVKMQEGGSDKTLQTLREVLEKLGTLDPKIVKH